MAITQAPVSPSNQGNGLSRNRSAYYEVVRIADNAVTTLTEREMIVWKMIAEGETTRGIARNLGISFKTAVAHRTHLMSKLGIHDVATLTRFAIRRKIVPV